MKVRRRQVVLSALATAGLWAVSALTLIVVLQGLPPELPRPQGPEPAPSSADPWLMIPDRLRRGETLAAVLRRNGFTLREIHDVAQALSPHVNLRHLRRGDEVEIRFSPSEGGESIRVHRGPMETYEARRTHGGWQGRRLEVRLERRERVCRGALKLGGSLYAAMEAIGETPELVARFAEVFQWDFDFYVQSRGGDRFVVVVEKLYRDEKCVGYGELKAARYISRETDLSAFLYEDPGGSKGYYDRQGRSMRKAFLRAPLKFRRISSGFSYARLHPIRKRRMPHLGVDYAAPVGTAVHSVASGTVVDISTKGGGGKQVTIRHPMGYTSKYLHLSRFAHGLRRDKRVQQKEVIGYVGMTGTATGPHLDFRLYKRGRPVNPLKQIYPPGPPVPEEYLEDFGKKMRRLARRIEWSRKTGDVVAE